MAGDDQKISGETGSFIFLFLALLLREQKNV
jgi:hypothetical protein